MSAERREEETMNESKVPREAAVAMVGEDAADALVREATVGIGLCPESSVVVAWGRAAMLVVPTKSQDFAPVSSAVAHTAMSADRGELRGRTTVEALREWCGPVEVWCHPEAAGGHDCQKGALFTLVCEGGRLVIAGLRADMLGTRSFTDGATGG